MGSIKRNDDFSWYVSLDDCKTDGYFPVKVTSWLCFFKLKGRTCIISTENIEPIRELKYVYLGKPTIEGEPVFYVSDYRDYSLNNLWFYKPDWPMLEVTEACEIFRNRCKLGEVWILFTKEQVADMSAMLCRIYKEHYKEEGKLDYKHWLAIAEFSVMFNDYREVAKNHTGFKTACKIFSEQERDLWKKAKSLKK